MSDKEIFESVSAPLDLDVDAKAEPQEEKSEDAGAESKESEGKEPEDKPAEEKKGDEEEKVGEPEQDVKAADTEATPTPPPPPGTQVLLEGAAGAVDVVDKDHFAPGVDGQSAKAAHANTASNGLPFDVWAKTLGQALSEQAALAKHVAEKFPGESKQSDEWCKIAKDFAESKPS